MALAMNAPMQLSSSNSLISLAMTVLPQEWLRQNHNWEQERWFRDGIASLRVGALRCAWASDKLVERSLSLDVLDAKLVGPAR